MQLIAAVAAQLGSASQQKPRPQDLIPAVTAWLEDPTSSEDGVTLSGKVINMLANEIEEDTVLKNTEDQLQEPVNTFAKELEALQPEEVGKLARNDGTRPDAWLPVPTIAATGGRRTLYTTVAFTPQLVQLEGADADAVERGFAGPVEVIPLEDLASTAQQPTRSEVSAIGNAQYRALQKTTALLRSLDRRADGVHVQLEEPQRDAADGEVADCSVDGWQELDVGKASSALGFGDRVRLRQRMAEDVQGEEGFVKTILSVVEAPGEMTMVWEIDIGEGLSRYVDFNDHSMVVSVPCTREVYIEPRREEEAGDNSSSDAEVGMIRWPACIESNMASPSMTGLGLFVNLGAFGISEGCFMDDCSHSDHFACKSPAECARTCRRIGSCRLWTFREASPATCWLRLNASHIEESSGALSANATCVPPDDDAATFEKPAKPTLFKLVSGQTGTPPPNLWEEWDLVGVLKDFGHMTLDEVRHARPSARQRSALRVAARSTSRCTSSWKGCAWS